MANGFRWGDRLHALPLEPWTIHVLQTVTLNQARANPVAARIDAAARCLNDGRYEHAQHLYSEILALAPNHPLALVGLGHLAILNHQNERGFDLLAAAASIHPDHPAILAGLAHAHGLFERHDAAIICLERAIAVDPDEPRHRCNLGEALVKQGRVDEALIQFETALARQPDHAASHLNLGIALFARDPDRAEHHLRRAAGIDPTLTEAKHSLATLLQTRGKLDQAIECAEAAYLDDPGRPSFMSTYGRLLADAGRIEPAWNVIRRCLALAPHDLDALEVSARLSLMKGEGDAAFRALASCVRRSPTDPEGLLALARSFAFAGRCDDALKLADEVLRLTPEHPNASALRTRLLFVLGRPEDAWMDTNAEDHAPACYYVGNDADPGEALLLARFLQPDAAQPAMPPLICAKRIGILLSHVSGLTVYESADRPQNAAPLGSLLARLRLTRTDIPGRTSYLAAHPANIALWTGSLAHFPGPRIGLLWSDRAECLTLPEIVSAMPQAATLISLADDRLRRQLHACPHIIDAGAHFEDYADVVAAVASVDAVVACDSVVAHIAGAMGKPGIVVAPANLPWCWGHEGGRSLWYPTLRVLAVPPALSERTPTIEKLGPMLADIVTPMTKPGAPAATPPAHAVPSGSPTA